MKSNNIKKITLQKNPKNDIMYLDQVISQEDIDSITLDIQPIPKGTTGVNFKLKNKKKSDLKIGILKTELICKYGLNMKFFEKSVYPCFTVCINLFDENDVKHDLIVNNLKRIDDQLLKLFLNDKITSGIVNEDNTRYKNILKFLKSGEDEDLNKPCVYLKLYLNTKAYDAYKESITTKTQISDAEFRKACLTILNCEILDVEKKNEYNRLERICPLDTELHPILNGFLTSYIEININGYYSNSKNGKFVSMRSTVTNILVKLTENSLHSINYKIIEEDEDKDEEYIDCKESLEDIPNYLDVKKRKFDDEEKDLKKKKLDDEEKE